MADIDDLSDEDVFDGVFTEAKQEPEAKPEPEAPAETPAEPKAEAPAPPPQHQVPLSELLETRRRAQEERQAREQAEQRIAQYEQHIRTLQQQQPKAQEVDFLVDPDRAMSVLTAQMDQRIAEAQQQNSNRVLNMSETWAIKTHGKEIVDQAFEAASANGYTAHFASARDPYGEMVDWYQQQLQQQSLHQALQETGGDLGAYLERQKAAWLAEMKSGNQPSQQNRALPPTLAGKPKSGTSDTAMSDEDIFASTFKTG